MGRLNTVKTLTGYDFSFKPSLGKAGIRALAELNLFARCEVVQLLRTPGTDQGHLPARSVWKPSKLARASRSSRLQT